MHLKYLSLCCCMLLAQALSANHESQDADTLYVWAQSGLRVRDTPSPDGEILEKLSFGSIVHILEKVDSNSVPYEVIAETTINEWEGKPVKKGVYKLKGHWVRVGYGKKTGYVFDQYLSRLKPVTDEVFKMHEKKFNGTDQFLIEIFMFINFGEKLSRKTTKLDEGKELDVHTYSRKAMFSYNGLAGIGVITMTLPPGYTLVEGYLYYRSLIQIDGAFLFSVKPNVIEFVGEYSAGSIKYSKGIVTFTIGFWT